MPTLLTVMTTAALLLGACGDNSTLNNCKTFVDRSGANDDRIVAFGGSVGNVYAPACIEIASGQTVTFVGDFTTYPLQPGTGPNAVTPPGGANPIAFVAPGTTTAPFAFPLSGSFPYFCTTDFSSGMMGVVKVK